jgi:hypothetical protein
MGGEEAVGEHVACVAYLATKRTGTGPEQGSIILVGKTSRSRKPKVPAMSVDAGNVDMNTYLTHLLRVVCINT